MRKINHLLFYSFNTSSFRCLALILIGLAGVCGSSEASGRDWSYGLMELDQNQPIGGYEKLVIDLPIARSGSEQLESFARISENRNDDDNINIEQLANLIEAQGLARKIEQRREPKSFSYLDESQIIPESFNLVNDEQQISEPVNDPLNFDGDLKSRSSDLNRGSQSQVSTPSSSHYGNSEYIDHPLAIIGHQYVQGGAGEGRQLLGPEGTFENVQVVKTDHAVPSYCDPPNPCPVGFTASDGCLENFINSASFSREYQAKQMCACDNEHSLFNCASPVVSGVRQSIAEPTQTFAVDSLVIETNTNHNVNNITEDIEVSSPDQQQSSDTGSGLFDAKLNTLARAIQNRFGDLPDIQRLMKVREPQVAPID